MSNRVERFTPEKFRGRNIAVAGRFTQLKRGEILAFLRGMGAREINKKPHYHSVIGSGDSKKNSRTAGDYYLLD